MTIVTGPSKRGRLTDALGSHVSHSHPVVDGNKFIFLIWDLSNKITSVIGYR